MKNEVCPGCGMRYATFRTGLTLKDAHSALVCEREIAGNHSKKPIFWKASLSRLKKFKREMWAEHLSACREGKMLLKKIYTHANCNDGQVVALLARKYLPYVPVVFVNYDSAEHRALCPEPGVLFADFTPHREGLDAWKEHSPIVLDHHIHAKDIVEELGGIFNQNQCGAMLFYTWLASNNHLRIEDEHEVKLVSAIDAADRYVTSSPFWPLARQLTATMGKLGFSVTKSMDAKSLINMAEWSGDDILADNVAQARDLVGKAVKLNVDGMEGLVTCTVGQLFLSGLVLEHSSSEIEVAAIVSLKMDFAGHLAKPKWQYSLRSRTADVGAFCSWAGGGGHKNAAGFSAWASSSPNYLIKPEVLLYEKLYEWAQSGKPAHRKEQNV